MRLQRSRPRLRAVAPADETEKSSDTTSDEATSEDDDSAGDKRPHAAVDRKNAARKSTGLYAEESVEDSGVRSSSKEDETEYQVQDNNDECCSTCGTKKDSDKLLCCELCPAVYHLYCLKPPLRSIPAGDWYCTHCRSILGLEHVDKFLAARTQMVDLEAERVAEEAAAQQRAEAAQATKRKAPSGTARPASKKRKTASVQQLHTAEPAANPAQTEQQSVPVDHSHPLETSGRQAEANGTKTEAEHSQRTRQDGAEDQAEGLNADEADSRPGTQHASCSEAQLPTGSGAAGPASVAPAKSELHPDATEQPSHAAGSKAAGKLTSVKEYYVKWKGKSYLHCSWVRHDDVLKVARHSAGLNMRFRNYQRSVYGMPQEASSGKLEDQEVGDLVNGIDPQWVLVDRVIAQQEKQGSGMQYLVKWRGLGYDECTWEALSDLLPKFKSEIAKFKNQQPIALELIEQQKLRSQQANKSQADTARSAAGRKVGTRKFSDSPSFLQGVGSLHPYQLEGLNWLYFAWEQRKHVILADEMGLGKTIQSIAFLAALKEEQVQRPHIVVVPLSTFPNWEREFALWAPQLNVVPFIGNQAGRNMVKQHELYADASLVKGKAKSHSKHAELQARVKFHVLLTTYEMVGFEAGTLRSLEYETLIVDEGHRLKNQQSKLFQQLHNFKTRQRTLLTGTPLQNNLSELWMLLHFLDAGKFQSLEEFQADFSDFSHGDQIGKLHELLSPHLLRRLKKDVLKQLPPKKEQIVRVELSPLQKDWYRGILTRNFPNLTSGKQTGRLKSVMMELRKCCNHPFLIEEQEWPTTRDSDQFLQQLVQASGKLALVDSMLARMKDRGHRVLIYSQFTTLLDLLEDWLIARKWGYQRIDGSVGGPERQSRIDQFNKRPADNFVFLLSTKAGGLGINLASADTVIIYDSDWNPHNDLQAQARAHRLGQLKPVMIYRLVTRLTIEERMMQQTKKKMVLEHLVVHKMNTAADLKQDELDDILRYGAAELFADAVAAGQQAQQAGPSTDNKGAGENGEAGSSGDPVNKAAAEKLIRLSEREQAEGRTGGQAGQRIVYDDAAIERLLDRSELASADVEQADEKEDDFVKGFKVANFEIIDSPDKGKKAAEEEAVLEAQPSAPPQAGAAFWEELLKAGYQDLQQAQMEVLGKGKRERRQVNYDEKTGKGRDDASDYSAQSEESAEESGEEDTPASKKRKSEGLGLSEAEAKAVQPIVQQRQASFGSSTTPLTCGVNHNYRVLGFTSTQRALFMKVLMQFGLGQQTTEGKFDWSHVHRHLAGRWPALTPDQTTKYAELVMAQLSEPASDKPFFTDGINKKDILQHYELNKVLDRLGTLHLVRHAVTQQMPQPDTAFNLGAAHAPMSRHLKIWQPQHDKKLLYGVLKHGWEQWLLILKDPLLGVEPILRQELFLLPPQPTAVSNFASVASSRSQLPTFPPGATTPAPDVATTTAAAAPNAGAVLAVGPAVGAVAGPSGQPATAAGPGTSSAPNTAETRPDGGIARTPPSQPTHTPAAAAGNGNSQITHGIKPEPLLPAPPVTAAGAPVTAAEDKLKEVLHVKVEIQPVSAEGLAAAAAPVSTSAMMGPSSSAGKLVNVKLEPAAASAAKSNGQQSSDAGSLQPGEAAGAPLPQATVAKPPQPAVSEILDLTTADIPSKSTADAGNGPAAAATAPVLAANAAATSTAKQPRQADIVTGPSAVTIVTSSSAPVVLGCPKCRWAPKGCSACRAKWQAAGNTLPAALAAGGSNSADAAAVAAAAAATRVERGTMTKLCNWLANRTAVLASILKGIHKVGTPVPAAPPQAQSRVTSTAHPVRLLPRPAGPVIITQQTSASHPPGTTGATVAMSTPVSTGQWQQSAVQMSQFRQQQRQLQQQQLAAAQEQQRQSLLLQQQQRQRHTSLLRQQHQTAQLQQQQQQAAKAQAAQAQLLQQQQLRIRQQQQQRGLHQQQVNQQHQLQLQLQLHQQQQRQLSSTQQVQRALSSQGPQQGARLQPPAAAAHVTAAPGAQQPTSSQAQISHPLSQPDKAGAPLLMSLHKQQAARASSPAVPGSPYSPSLSRQQSNHSGGQSRQHPTSPFGLPQQQSISNPLSQQLPQQQPLHQQVLLQQARTVSQSQLQGQGLGQAPQQALLSPLDPKFQLLPEAERLKVLRHYLLAQKPSLQPLEVPQAQPHTSPENLQEKRELVAVYNELCSTLLGVQVTLSQNKPTSMTAQDRHAAAASFQNSMQELRGHCEEMVKTLVSGQAQSITQMEMQKGSRPQLQPVLRHHCAQSSARSHSPVPQPQASASQRQGGATQPSSPASSHTSTAPGLHGTSASASCSRASAGAASPLVRAASGSQGLTHATSGVSSAAGTVRAVPGDAQGSMAVGVPIRAQPRGSTLASWAFGKSSVGSPLVAGRHSAAGMQASQVPGRVGPPPTQSGDVYTPSLQAMHQNQNKLSVPKRDSSTQAGSTVALGVPQARSSRPQHLASIDLTVDSDDNSK